MSEHAHTEATPRKYRDKPCRNCGEVFSPKGPNSRWCDSCTGRPPDPGLCAQNIVACRRCGADAGQQCITSNGLLSEYSHLERCEDSGVVDPAREQRRLRNRKRNHVRRRAIKDQILEHYGTSCACCGSTENLQVDHINGDGKQHREQISGLPDGGRSWAAAGSVMWQWIIDNGFPSGLQILCGPCNNSKRNGARCRLMHEPACPTCHRPFDESIALDRRGHRIWSPGAASAA